MPKTLSWRRIAWALAGAAALFGLKPAPAKADALVATFAACLEDQQPARRFVPQHVSPGHGARDMAPWIGFTAYDPGPAQPEAAPTRSSSAVRKVLLLRQLVQNRAALAALVLMVGNIPQMPPLETPTPLPLLSGPPDHGVTNVPPDTQTPPAAPEPAALLSALLGGGGVGGYALLRRRRGRLRLLP